MHVYFYPHWSKEMDQKELVSGNRDPLLEFADTMAQWYRCFMAEQSEKRSKMRSPCKKYPLDSSPLLDCPCNGRSVPCSGVRVS